MAQTLNTQNYERKQKEKKTATEQFLQSPSGFFVLFLFCFCFAVPELSSVSDKTLFKATRSWRAYVVNCLGGKSYSRNSTNVKNGSVRWIALLCHG